jgi:hypothetical protein
MIHLCQRRVLLRGCVAAVLAVAGMLWSARPAAAQYVIAPDGSSVYLGPQGVLPLGGQYMVGPVAVYPGNQFIRVNGAWGGTIYTPGPNLGITPFMRPIDSTGRAQASYLYGGKNKPYPPVIGPWQPWW